MVALAEMATLLAHEIRNPLEALSCLPACSQPDAGLTDDSQKWVQHLQAGVRSLAATVNNVLRFHTPGSAPLVVPPSYAASGGWVEFASAAGSSRPGLRSNWKRRLESIDIMCDAGGLQQVLLNLAHNALPPHPCRRHALECEPVWMSALSGDSLSIEVSDTGNGISPEDLPRIFEAGFEHELAEYGAGISGL